MFYIGSTLNWKTFRKRVRNHLIYHCYVGPFQTAYRKNPNSFSWEFFEDGSAGREMEQALLNMFYGKSQCYNVSPCAYRPPTPKFKREEHPTYGLHWWVREDGTKEVLSEGCPGPGWKRGRKEVPRSARIKQARAKKNVLKSQEHKQKIAQSRLGRLWWVNKEGKLKCQKESPGPEWHQGRVWRDEFTA